MVRRASFDREHPPTSKPIHRRPWGRSRTERVEFSEPRPSTSRHSSPANRRPRPWRRPPTPRFDDPVDWAPRGVSKREPARVRPTRISHFLRFFWSNSGVDFRRQSGVGPSGRTIGREIIDRRAGLSKEESPWPSTARTALNSSARSPRNSLGRRDPSWARQAPRRLPRPDPGAMRARQERSDVILREPDYVAEASGSPLRQPSTRFRSCRNRAVGAEWRLAQDVLNSSPRIFEDTRTELENGLEHPPKRLSMGHDLSAGG